MTAAASQLDLNHRHCERVVVTMCLCAAHALGRPTADIPPSGGIISEMKVRGLLPPSLFVAVTVILIWLFRCSLVECHLDVMWQYVAHDSIISLAIVRDAFDRHRITYEYKSLAAIRFYLGPNIEPFYYRLPLFGNSQQL